LIYGTANNDYPSINGSIRLLNLYQLSRFNCCGDIQMIKYLEAITFGLFAAMGLVTVFIMGAI